MLSILSYHWGLAVLAVCWAAAIKDIKTYTIPHIYPGMIIALFILGLFFNDLTLPFFAWQALCVALLFAAGFILFVLNAMGGGDVKLFAALGLWVPMSELGIYLMIVTLIGSFTALIILIFRSLKFINDPENPEATFKSALNKARKTKHQYGLPIALGTSVFVLLGILS